VTNDKSIKVEFAKTLPNNRGSAIVGIQLAMDDGYGGVLTTVMGEDESQLTLQTSYVANSTIVKGQTYRFRCRVLNNIGWSAWSSPDTYIIAAVSPSKPSAPIL
jgi:hypothetical protein